MFSAVRHLFILLAFACLTPAAAQAERIRTSIPGLNLNYLSVFTAGAKGKKIGVSLIGDSEDRFTTLFVERGGLSAKDVTKISLSTSPGDRILAIKSGGVSAVVLDPAATVMAEREGLRSLAYLGDMFPLPFQGYVTTHQKISENPAQVKRWIRAMIRSLIFLRERPGAAAEI